MRDNGIFVLSATMCTAEAALQGSRGGHADKGTAPERTGSSVPSHMSARRQRVVESKASNLESSSCANIGSGAAATAFSASSSTPACTAWQARTPRPEASKLTTCNDSDTNSCMPEVSPCQTASQSKTSACKLLLPLLLLLQPLLPSADEGPSTEVVPALAIAPAADKRMAPHRCWLLVTLCIASLTLPFCFSLSLSRLLCGGKANHQRPNSILQSTHFLPFP
mmetsp:Transcript_118563/g.377941  ORF Transcript_118563/g.377941 Transcript_118563/m.377941 type:complete len:223 (+) Transcript_118563:562-1230(+)